MKKSQQNPCSAIPLTLAQAAAASSTSEPATDTSKTTTASSEPPQAKSPLQPPTPEHRTSEMQDPLCGFPFFAKLPLPRQIYHMQKETTENMQPSMPAGKVNSILRTRLRPFNRPTSLPEARAAVSFAEMSHERLIPSWRDGSRERES